MGIYAGPAPMLYEVNGQLLTYDEYEFWKFMGEPSPLQFAKQLRARKRLQLSQQNTNKQTPRPPFDPRDDAAFAARQKEIEDAVTNALKAQAREFAKSRRIPVPATGPTTRLPTVCRVCGDTLPPGAMFCIECGERV
jgi:hypothetical protein